MLFPKPLKPGDKVAVIGLSSWTSDEKVDPALEAVRKRGFEVVEFPSCRAKHWCFSGTDEQRAKDFEEAMCDDSIDGVFCIRGGYGAARALELVNWARVKAAVERNPKYFSVKTEQRLFAQVEASLAEVVDSQQLAVELVFQFACIGLNGS